MRDRLRKLRELAGSPTIKRLKEHADSSGHSVSRAALAGVTAESDSLPRWATVEAFIDACASYAKARKRPLSDDDVNMLDWRSAYDRVHSERTKGRLPIAADRSTASAEIVDYDVRQDGLFALGIWSPARRLEPSRLLTEAMPPETRPVQPYIDSEVLAEAVRERSRKASGATVYMTGFRIDHRESDETQYCRVSQAPSIYPEVLAIEDLRLQRPELFEECDKVIERDIRDYLANPVPSSLAVNLVVVSSENDELLCVERSAATDSAVGLWTIGVFETMKQPELNRPGAPEDIYGLAMRGLNEELGLQPSDYHPIQVSWIGIFRPILRGHIVAVLKLRISKGEAHSRARSAHSAYEHAAIDWIPLRRSLVQAFVQARRSLPPNLAGSTLEVNNRTWNDQARLGVLEAWRFRNVLDS